MTAKRFTLAYADYDWWAICDKENPTERGISGEDIVELLNELNDENEQLKKDILRLMYTAEHLVDIKKLEEKWNIDYKQFVSDLINGDEHL